MAAPRRQRQHALLATPRETLQQLREADASHVSLETHRRCLAGRADVLRSLSGRIVEFQRMGRGGLSRQTCPGIFDPICQGPEAPRLRTETSSAPPTGKLFRVVLHVLGSGLSASDARPQGLHIGGRIEAVEDRSVGDLERQERLRCAPERPQSCVRWQPLEFTGAEFSPDHDRMSEVGSPIGFDDLRRQPAPRRRATLAPAAARARTVSRVTSGTSAGMTSRS